MAIPSTFRACAAIALFLALVPAAPAQYSGGTGEPNDPYQIATAADLIALGETPEDYDKHFILTADIDLDPNLPGRRVFDKAVIAPDTNDVTDVTESFEGTQFTGIFEGNGHTISRLTINGTSWAGLFGRLGFGAKVTDLGVVDADITGSGTEIGALTGANVGGSVTRCYSSGVVSGASNVGGLVGFESSPDFGGAWLTIMDCYSTAAVSASAENAGGLVGYNEYGTILRCYSTGFVAAAAGSGGLVGADTFGSVTDCFWDIETSVQATSIGGTGKTTAEMCAAGTFVLWGACVSVWTIDNGQDYPRLAWENAPGQIIGGPTYAGGSGTIEDPFLIASAEDLATLGLCSCHWDRHFKLVTDIDLSGRMWAGPVVLRFSGIFDGNGHTVSHLAITGGSYLGLFGQVGSWDVRGAEIRNLGLVDVNIAGSGDRIGSLMGVNYGSIANCYSTSSVSGDWSVGGLVGSNHGSITTSYSSGSVSGLSNVGGLVGGNNGSIDSSYSSSTVSATGEYSSAGGLVGSNHYGTITTSYSTGAVTGASAVGGLIGGSRSGDVRLCYSTSAVVGNENVGGLIGRDHAGGAVETCYAAGYVTGSGAVGGLVGLNESVLMDSFSLSIVSGNNRVGGLVGKNSNAVRRCYSAGAVNGDQYVGGLVGSNVLWNGTITESFWDVVSSGSSRMCGLGSGDNSLGRNTAEMQTAATFLDAGWDFAGETENGTDDIWWILEGEDYPRLWWEAVETEF